MTIEQLRAEAKKLGCYVYPKIPREKLIPCTCGCNRRTHVYNRVHGVTLVCKKCGRHASGYFDNEARSAWNEMIEEELKNHDDRSPI